MHLILLMGVFGFAWGLRYTWTESAGAWGDRWQQTLMSFLLPPLLLCTSAIAIIWMGPHGQMVWPWEGWLSYGLALSFTGFSLLWGLKLVKEGTQTLQQIRTFPVTHWQNTKIRVLDVPTLYSAQVGFWHPELVMSQKLLDTLQTEHLEAVIAHEQAHRHYRDTFWFFGLGWLRRITAWLPQTESLWQELLLLRELRADRWAAQSIDALLLAEALLLVVKDFPIIANNFCAAFSSFAPPNRLTQRIESLLMEAEPMHQSDRRSWLWLLLAFSPLFVVPFHH